MKKLTQKGFGVVEVLLLILLAGLVVGCGYYVYSQAHKNDDTNQPQGSVSTYNKKSAQKSGAKDETADWVPYSSAEGVYSLKYPKTWVIATNLNLCNPGLLLLGANAASVGKCATESFGQIAVDSSVGNNVAERKLAPGDYSDLATTNVTINGVAGIKQVGKYSGAVSDVGFGPNPGDKQVKYLFFTNNRTYTATYVVNSGATVYPDALKDFDTLVTKTLKFQP